MQWPTFVALLPQFGDEQVNDARAAEAARDRGDMRRDYLGRQHVGSRPRPGIYALFAPLAQRVVA